MAKQTKVDQENLKAFFEEVKDSKSTESSEKKQTFTQSFSKPYQCPKCHQSLSSRKEPCKHCGYTGYIPMSEAETKRIRAVLFVVILVIAIVVYILTRK